MSEQRAEYEELADQGNSSSSVESPKFVRSYRVECEHCGSTRGVGVKFCPHCGEQVRSIGGDQA